MRFAVGYQQRPFGAPFSEIIHDYRDSIAEVFFAWPGAASGRPPVMQSENSVESLFHELRAIRKDGIALDFLMNANCYGDDALSLDFQCSILDMLKRMADEDCRPAMITTTSPFVAHTVKTCAADIEVRASVNMRIGTTQAMDYAGSLFDSFYLQRDYQRNIDYVRRVSDWCRTKGKKLCMLANSGCLRFCPGQTFHDNIIAHCVSIGKRANADWNPHVCWNLYQNPDRRSEFLKSTWIRPEDICHYEGLIDVCKLATRQHSHPRSVIAAYVSGHWDGNLLELMEPGFSPAFTPMMIDNTRIPNDFWYRTGHCLQGCSGCGYCEKVLQQALVHESEMYHG